MSIRENFWGDFKIWFNSYRITWLSDFKRKHINVQLTIAFIYNLTYVFLLQKSG